LEVTMRIARLPITVRFPHNGWIFHGSWSTGERAAIERTLRERLLNPDPSPGRLLALSDPRYGLLRPQPSIHAAGIGYCATSAVELTEALWDHYFALRLGPLAWSPPQAPHDPSAPPVAAEAAGESSSDPYLLNLEREWEALEHFETAGTLLADGEYAAAKRELELSLAINPATSFYDHKRVEMLGDIESCLGSDDAACLHYQHALALAPAWQESWTYIELRVKLAWCLLRVGRLDEA
jgi:hypothetical protein